MSPAPPTLCRSPSPYGHANTISTTQLLAENASRGASELRQSYDRATTSSDKAMTELRHPLYQRIKLVWISCGRPVPLEQPAIAGKSFEDTGRRSAVCSLRSRGDRRRMVPSATRIKNGTVDLPFSREELMAGILNDDSAA